MNQAPVFDRNHLLEMTDGDVAFERELLSTFRASAQSTLTRLRTALSGGELVQIAREAHLLKGACLNVGAASLAECAGAIETASRAGDLAGARDGARQLDAREAALWAALDRV